LQGLRLIDLCREVFDVVVMNPPFGALASGTKDQLAKAYPRSKNDLAGHHGGAGLELLRPGGRHWSDHLAHLLLSVELSEMARGIGARCIAKPEVMADLGTG
jgi:hypothetical protein